MGVNSAGNMDLVIDLFLRCLMDGFLGNGPGMLFPISVDLPNPYIHFPYCPHGLGYTQI
jgi:hypothetical protein